MVNDEGGPVRAMQRPDQLLYHPLISKWWYNFKFIKGKKVGRECLRLDYVAWITSPVWLSSQVWGWVRMERLTLIKSCPLGFRFTESTFSFKVSALGLVMLQLSIMFCPLPFISTTKWLYYESQMQLQISFCTVNHSLWSEALRKSCFVLYVIGFLEFDSIPN